MSDDELDPAFADLDLPAPGGSSLASFAGDFGSSLDADDDDDKHGDSALYEAHGDTLDAALDSDDELGSRRSLGQRLGGEDLEDLGYPRCVHTDHSGGRNFADSPYDDERSSDDELGSAFRTPSRQQRARGRAERQQQSLASELASVGRPRREQNLLRELGLDDGDGSLAEELDSGGHNSAASGSDASDRGDEAGASRRPRPSSDRNTVSPTRKSRNSSRILVSSSVHLNAGPPDEEQNSVAEEQEVEKEHSIERNVASAAQELSHSASDIDAFLKRLRDHSASFDPASNLDPSTARNPPGADPSRPQADAARARDRQTVVEDLAATLLRSLQSSATRRVDEVREMTGLERDLGRAGPLALAQVDAMPLGPLNTGDVAQDTTASSTEDDAARAATEAPAPSTSSALSNATAELSQLRETTQSLLSLLASLAEQSQVQSALSSDAGRKLRALRTQLATLKDEHDNLRRSEDFVRHYEARYQAGREGDAARDRGASSAQVRADVEEIRDRLEGGWRRAREMLVISA
ncbi:hypothetical protein JCM8202_000356 [Rhodotorula sphaerocarpa]